MKIREPLTPRDNYKYFVNDVELAVVTVFNDLGMVITDTRDMRQHYYLLKQRIRVHIAIMKKNLWKPDQKLGLKR